MKDFHVCRYGINPNTTISLLHHNNINKYIYLYCLYDMVQAYPAAAPFCNITYTQTRVMLCVCKTSECHHSFTVHPIIVTNISDS